MEPKLKPWRARKRNPTWNKKKIYEWNPNEIVNETLNDILKKLKTTP